MSARGRGRGGRGGNTKSFTKEQLNAIGAATNEVPSLVTQPPSLYPIFDKRPIPLTVSKVLNKKSTILAFTVVKNKKC